MCDVLNHISHVDVIVLAIVLIELDVVNLVGVVLGRVAVEFGVDVAAANLRLLLFSQILSFCGSVRRISVAVLLDVTRYAT